MTSFYNCLKIVFLSIISIQMTAGFALEKTDHSLVKKVHSSIVNKRLNKIADNYKAIVLKQAKKMGNSSKHLTEIANKIDSGFCSLTSQKGGVLSQKCGKQKVKIKYNSKWDYVLVNSEKLSYKDIKEKKALGVKIQ